MLDLAFVRAHPDAVTKAAKLKGVEVDVQALLKLDDERRQLQKKYDDLRAIKNKESESVAKLAGGQRDKAVAKLKEIDTTEADLKPKILAIEEKFREATSLLPNPPLPEVPEGKDENNNVEVKKWGQPLKYDFPTLDHLEIGQRLDLIDVERGAKTSGSRFYFLKNEAVLLEFALVQFAFHLLVKEGFRPLIVPVLVKKPVMWSGGYLEHGAGEEIYKSERDELYLIGTAEQAMVGLHADEVLDESSLPLRYAAFSTCFRREAGSYGKDVKGIFRVHQFDKVEMFSFTKGEVKTSAKEHQYFLSLEEKVMQGLKLPYRVVQMCTGDLGLAFANKLDIEAWFPSQNRYRETHSTSNATDWQARRANTKYKEGKDSKFVHTVNGTSVAMARMIAAILENYQQKDGTVKVPEALHRYLPFTEIRPKK